MVFVCVNIETIDDDDDDDLNDVNKWSFAAIVICIPLIDAENLSVVHIYIY